MSESYGVVPENPIPSAGQSELIQALKSHIRSLQARVKELETENARLSSFPICVCNKIQDASPFQRQVVERPFCSKVNCGVNGTMEGGVDSEVGVHPEAGTSHGVDYGKSIGHTKNKSEEAISGPDSKSMSTYLRFVALKVMYFGQRFHGFASEATTHPTVESEILKALRKTKLLTGEKNELSYSRCGRTDRGVSAVGQVIAVNLRSNLKDSEKHENCKEEIDYVKVLNKALPHDIRVLGWSPAPSNFHARFSCLSREYKYFFWRGSLDISAMEVGGRKLVGEHDFRNFCKMDALNVHNYRRHILSFEIAPCSQRFYGNELWAIKIKGTAFLWHQVRCIVAVLFMIGQDLESPSVIDALLDISETPSKPQYSMAVELPLVLQCCEFEDLNFICSTGARQALVEQLRDNFLTYLLQAAIFQEALATLSVTDVCNVPTRINGGNHIPLKSRPTEPSYEERRVKLAEKGNSKKSIALPSS